MGIFPRRQARIGSLLAVSVSFLATVGVTGATATESAETQVLDVVPARLTYSGVASSLWDVRIDTGANTIVATHADGQVLTVDYDDVADDNHRVGVSPDVGCGPLEGNFFGARTSFIYPILDPRAHRIDEVGLWVGAEELRIRMSGGSYRILDPAADDERLFMDARFSVVDGELRGSLSGLYYLLPSKSPGTTLTLETADGDTLTRTIDLATPAGVEYIDDVRSIEADDGAYGRYELTSDIERLQIQTNATPSLTVFELDADHTFKDLGQKTVNTDVKFEDQTCP